MNLPRLLVRSVAIAALLLSVVWTADRACAAEGTYRVYIGTFTGHGSKGIYLMQLDAASGALTQPQLVAEANSPAFLALHPNHQFLYSVNEVDKGTVSAFAIDAPSGKLTPLNQQPSGGHGPTHLTVDATGTNVLVANYNSGSVAVLPIATDGKLGTPSSTDQHKGTGPDRSRQEGPHAHCFNVDPNSRFALSCDLGLDKVFVYRLDPAAHTITPSEPAFATVAPGAGPRHLSFSPDGRRVYVVSEMGGTVTGFGYDPEHGALREFQTISTLPADFKGQKGDAEVAVHPSGKFLYASNRGDANSIAIFTIDPSSGKLTAAGHVSTQGKAPRDFTIDPSGTWLLAANQDTNNIVEFRIDQQTGALTPTSVNIAAPTPVCITFVPLSK
jgi:6-phosphogluconolactonase